MRKLLLLCTALFLFSASFGTSNVETPVLRADQLVFPVGASGQKVTFAQLATMSVADFQALTGKKMNFIQRINFHIAQHKMKESIASDGTIKNRRIEKLLTKNDEIPETGFHIGGFALGFFLGLIGMLIAYMIEDKHKKNRVKWAWIGFVTIIIINLTILVAEGGLIL